MVKNLPANARDAGEADLIPGLEDPLEEQMATHSSILSWKIPWTEEAGVAESDMTEYGHSSNSKERGQEGSR